MKVHLHNIYSKLGVKNRTALAVLALTEFASVRMLPHAANYLASLLHYEPGALLGV